MFLTDKLTSITKELEMICVLSETFGVWEEELQVILGNF